MLNRWARPNSSVASTYLWFVIPKYNISKMDLALQFFCRFIPRWLQGFAVSTPLHPLCAINNRRYRCVETKKPDSRIWRHYSFIKCGVVKINHIYTLLSSIADNTGSIHNCSKKSAYKKESIYNEFQSGNDFNHTYRSLLSRKSLNPLISSFCINKQRLKN